MFTCYMYYPLEPIREQYIDKGKNILCEFKVLHNYQIALIGKDDDVQLIRISIPTLKEEQIPEDALEIIQEIKEHMLSIIIYLNGTTENISFWNFIEGDKPPDLNMRVKFGGGKHDYDSVERIFASTWNNRILFRLFLEGEDNRIPMNYRYLSLYRIMEINYKDKGSWTNEYDILLEEYKLEFEQLETKTKSLKGYIETIRNNCAHGKFIYKKNNRTGLTQFNNKGLIEIIEFMPLMQRMVKEAINTVTHGEFSMQ